MSTTLRCSDCGSTHIEQEEKYFDVTGLSLFVGQNTWVPNNPFWRSPPSWARAPGAVRESEGPRYRKGDCIIALEVPPGRK